MSLAVMSRRSPQLSRFVQVLSVRRHKNTALPNCIFKDPTMFKLSMATAASAVAVTLLTVACGTPPANLDLSLQRPSAQGKFMVSMDPPASGPAINQMHVWQVHVATPDGQPVSHATIGFDGGMPQHGHGFPTKPRITREVAPGVYALEGMKFSMTGWWDMKLAIQAGGVADGAEFNVIVDDSGIKR
ncbi:FixH family protein [Burkholderia ubonensis]|uniref:FixH family protein n=1 Tax=Burkholderia ubonensis TaxID=101571 RepID=UPI001E39CE35|nr:FixH family protein [Burkholderia ubonensis]